MTAMRKSMATVGQQSKHDLVAFTMDQETSTALEEFQTGTHLTCEVQRVVSFADTIEYLSISPTPNYLIIDLGMTSDVMSAVEQLSEVCDPETQVILIGEVNDLHLYRELIGLGIADYLVKPLNQQALSDIFSRLKNNEAEVATANTGTSEVSQTKVLAVIGVRGGAGASTVAANISAQVSNSLQKQTALIDMDLTFGTQAVTFDVEPGAGLSDAMMEPGRMDELFIKRASTRINEWLQLMAAETDPSRGDIASAESLSGLLNYVRDDAEIVVVDLPRSTLIQHHGMIDQFDHVLLVAEPTLPSMRDCARMKTLITAAKPEMRISVVLNKIGMAGKEGLPITAFEEGAGLKVAHQITFDAKTALNADARGKCLVQLAPKTKIAKDLINIADDISGASKAKKRGSLTAFLTLGSKRQKKDVTEHA